MSASSVWDWIATVGQVFGCLTLQTAVQSNPQCTDPLIWIIMQIADRRYDLDYLRTYSVVLCGVQKVIYIHRIHSILTENSPPTLWGVIQSNLYVSVIWIAVQWLPKVTHELHVFLVWMLLASHPEIFLWIQRNGCHCEEEQGILSFRSSLRNKKNRISSKSVNKYPIKWIPVLCCA